MFLLTQSIGDVSQRNHAAKVKSSFIVESKIQSAIQVSYSNKAANVQYDHASYLTAPIHSAHRTSSQAVGCGACILWYIHVALDKISSIDTGKMSRLLSG